MKNLNKNFLEVIEEMERFDAQARLKIEKDIRREKGEITPLSVPRITAEKLAELVKEKNPEVVLELGTSIGYSTIWLASGITNPKGKVYTIESARNKIEKAKGYFKRAGFEEKIVQIEGKILEVLPKWNKKIDFVFIDAEKKDYFKYLSLMEQHLSDGAIIVADNVLDFGHLMKDYLNYVKNSKKYESKLIKIDHGLMISVKL